MRLCFLYCRQYAPYSKWFGTAFQQLPIPQELKDAIGAAVAATDTTQREDNLCLLYTSGSPPQKAASPAAGCPTGPTPQR